MPTRLSNGLMVFNGTPHDLRFYDEDSGKTTVAPSDRVINAKPWTTTVANRKSYTLNTMMYLPTDEGRELIEQVKSRFPEALIVGSVLACHAYPEEVVAVVPFKQSRVSRDNILVRLDRFIIVKKEDTRHG